VLQTSAFSVRLSDGAFSPLWLNLPFDADDEQRRLEHAFLTSLARALWTGRVLVFLVPSRVVEHPLSPTSSTVSGAGCGAFGGPTKGPFLNPGFLSSSQPE
jgi:hypothetical protein